MEDPYSLVDGVPSPISPLTTFSIDKPARGEIVSRDDLHIIENTHCNHVTYRNYWFLSPNTTQFNSQV